MKRLALFSLFSLLVPFFLAAQLVYEAEDCVVNKSAMKKNALGSKTHWNLWSTDQNADKKWSKGIVIQSPVVKQERKSPEEGAPVLHLRVADIPKGTYTVKLKSVSRVAGISFDGKSWKPTMGGVIRANEKIENGVFEFWFDDRYAMKEEAARGSCYLDTIILTPVGKNGGKDNNYGFEKLVGSLPLNWGMWSREAGKIKVEVESKDVHGGKHAVRIVHNGDKDWAFSCNGSSMKVKEGQEFQIKAWVKSKETQSASLDVVGCDGEGKTVSWSLGGARIRGTHDWKEVSGFAFIRGKTEKIYLRFAGSGNTDMIVDDISIAPAVYVKVEKPKVKGWSAVRTFQAMERSLVALPQGEGMRLSWRLLKEDPADVSFDVFSVVDGKQNKLNKKPISRVTEFWVSDPVENAAYLVRPRSGNGPVGRAEIAEASDYPDGASFFRFKLNDPESSAMTAGFTDLDGDGKFDVLVKTPSTNIDPWHKYWHKSEGTYKIEAYLHDGKHLWTKDLGWAIERGIWYSPWIAVDLTGDGRAEVAAKIGEGDPRDEDGKVTSGPEWIAVFNGMTGKEIARAPWPDRSVFPSYNYFSRNQIAMAYLDGKTPCLLALRGTYNRMVVDAYQLVGGKLEKLWHYDNEDLRRMYWGQGAHFTLCHDIDDDGRDEVILGSAVIDDNGVPLWSTGKGHPDYAYLCDMNPLVPGLEIGYGIETRNSCGGLGVVSAKTGKYHWMLQEKTKHVHGKGICADIDPTQYGIELYGGDADGHKKTDFRWLFSATGKLLDSGPDGCHFAFGRRTGWWDEDLQEEFIGSRSSDYQGGAVPGRISGSVKDVVDIMGDWREEIVTSSKGELRIYCTTIPATDRRVCLAQDKVYRMTMDMNTMGYSQRHTLSYNPIAVSPGLNLTFKGEDPEQTATCQLVVSAPVDRPVKGTVRLEANNGMKLTPDKLQIEVAPGTCEVRDIEIKNEGKVNRGEVQARFEMGGDDYLTASTLVKLASSFLKEGIFAQAEDFSAQTGGEVRIRTDKPGVQGKCISHWDDKGHTLSWDFPVAKAGRYKLVIRYSVANNTTRLMELNGQDLGEKHFFGTGGFGTAANQWMHAEFAGEKEKGFRLEAGKTTFKFTNPKDKNGLNLDYLALVPMP